MNLHVTMVGENFLLKAILEVNVTVLEPLVKKDKKIKVKLNYNNWEKWLLTYIKKLRIDTLIETNPNTERAVQWSALSLLSKVAWYFC